MTYLLTYERYIGGANLHPGAKLHSGAKIHPGANVAHEHGFRY